MQLKSNQIQLLKHTFFNGLASTSSGWLLNNLQVVGLKFKMIFSTFSLQLISVKFTDLSFFLFNAFQYGIHDILAAGSSELLPTYMLNTVIYGMTSAAFLAKLSLQ